MTIGIDPIIELVRGSQTLNLNDLDAYIRLAEDGLGIPDVTRLTERGPLQNGDTDLGFRLEPRTVQLVVGLFGGNDVTEYWNLRRTLQQMLKPSSVPLALRYTLPSGEVRQLDVVYAGGLTWPSDQRLITAHRAAFALRASDPVLYEPIGRFASFGIAVTAAVFGFPISFPISFGQSSTIDTTLTISYAGSWRDAPTIEVIGPIENLKIEQLSTGEVLDFTGTTIATGNTWLIDCRPGRATITDQTGASQIAALTDDSDLATFSLHPDPDVPDGLNDIRVTGVNATVDTQVYVRYVHRYIGV